MANHYNSITEHQSVNFYLFIINKNLFYSLCCLENYISKHCGDIKAQL